GWAWVAEDGRFETGGEPRSTNNVAELTAIQRAVAAHPDRPLLISTDSQYAMNCIVQWGPGWIRRGDSSKANFALIVAIIEAIRARPAGAGGPRPDRLDDRQDRKSTRLNSSHVSISYAVLCVRKK